MKSLLFIAVAIAPLLWLGCSSAAPPVSSQSVDDAGAPGDSGSTSDGSTKDGASKDGAIVDGSADADDGFTGPPPPPPVCGSSSTWQPGTVVAVSTSDDDILDVVTADELSIAWTRTPSSGPKTVYYADRALATDAFGAAQNLGAGNFTVDRVGLSPDGLTMVVVNADQLGFSELSRAARGDAFGAPATGAFSNIDTDTPAGSMVGDPVVDSSNTTFYYSLYGNGATKTVFRAVRLTPADAWGFGFAIDAASDLEANGSLRCRPSGVSPDDRTLYYFDSFHGAEKSVYVDTTTGEWDTFVDLGARTWAAPAGSSCSKLYYSSTGTSSIDIFVATH